MMLYKIYNIFMKINKILLQQLAFISRQSAGSKNKFQEINRPSQFLSSLRYSAF